MALAIYWRYAKHRPHASQSAINPLEHVWLASMAAPLCLATSAQYAKSSAAITSAITTIWVAPFKGKEFCIMCKRCCAIAMDARFNLVQVSGVTIR